MRSAQTSTDRVSISITTAIHTGEVAALLQLLSDGSARGCANRRCGWRQRSMLPWLRLARAFSQRRSDAAGLGLGRCGRQCRDVTPSSRSQRRRNAAGTGPPAATTSILVQNRFGQIACSSTSLRAGSGRRNEGWRCAERSECWSRRENGAYINSDASPWVVTKVRRSDTIRWDD